MARKRSHSMGLLTNSSQPSVEAFIAVFGHRVSGHGNDRLGETASAELSYGIIAVDDRHLHIDDDRVKWTALGDGLAGTIKDFLAVAGHYHVGTALCR